MTVTMDAYHEASIVDEEYCISSRFSFILETFKGNDDDIGIPA